MSMDNHIFITKVGFVLIALSISTQGLPHGPTKRSNSAIAEAISLTVVNRLQKALIQGHNLSVFNKLTKTTPIIPPIDDPLYLNTLELPLNFTGIGDFDSSGVISYCTPEVTGLSRLTDTLEFEIDPTLSLKWNLEVPRVAIKGLYKLDQVVNLPFPFIQTEQHVINGEGELTGTVDNVFVKLDATGNGRAEKLQIDTLSLDMGFSNLTLHAENTTIDGKPQSFDALSQIIERAFELIWTDALKVFVSEAVGCSINHLIGNCTLEDILEENFDCLDTTTDPSCFLNEDRNSTTELPTTVPTSTSGPIEADININIHSKVDIHVQIENLIKFAQQYNFDTKDIGYCDQFITSEPSPTTTISNPTLNPSAPTGSSERTTPDPTVSTASSDSTTHYPSVSTASSDSTTSDSSVGPTVGSTLDPTREPTTTSSDITSTNGNNSDSSGPGRNGWNVMTLALITVVSRMVSTKA